MGKGTEFKIPKARIEVKALVRDKHGNPKFDDPKLIKHYLHRLSDEDKLYLEKQYGEGICSSDDSA